MEGRREEPVREQEAGDGRRESGQDAADRTHRDDERQEQQQHGLEADVVPYLHQEEREQWEAGDGEGPTRDLAAAGKR